jgi:hypothetical protein
MATDKYPVHPNSPTYRDPATGLIEAMERRGAISDPAPSPKLKTTIVSIALPFGFGESTAPHPIGGVPKDAFHYPKDNNIYLVLEVPNDQPTGEVVIIMGHDRVPEGFTYLTLIDVPEWTSPRFLYYRMDH